MKIKALSEDLINKIAAGEVVERPASVIKELMENSLDAGATRIDVLLKEGGLTEIAIIDNGCGMGEEDLLLSVERHTTSKISSMADLEAIASFGFRGEALSSTASVSDLEIFSREQNQDAANALRVVFGEKEPLRPAGTPFGTAVYVRHLFARVPARRKYLRSAATEFSYCSKIVREIALGNPQVSFSLTHNGRQIGNWISPTREKRVVDCLKPDWDPLFFHDETEGIRYEAILSPTTLLQERGELYLFLNGRPVRNRSLLAAVRNSYAEALGSHHEPSGAVYLDIEHSWVDVNVHPQKWEVRCLRQERVYQWLNASLRKLVSQNKPASLPEEKEVPDLELNLPLSRFRYLGQVKSTYLVCEDSGGVILVDRKALQEKLQLQKLKTALDRGSIPSEPLSVPKILHLEISKKAELEKLGFDLEEFSEGDVVLKGKPVPLTESEAEAALKEMLVEFTLEKGLETLARHIPDVDANSLLLDLEKTESDWTSSAGKPILYRLSFESIQKHFT
jgi:DNA mismatch repair protein MutL